MRLKILSVLLFILFNLANGQTSSSDSLKMREGYWQNNSYIPLPSEVFGEYSWHDGFSGADLILRTDSSFQYQEYSDVVMPQGPRPGFKGLFYFHFDTLRFIYKGYVIDTSSSLSWRNELLGKQSKTIEKLNSRNSYLIFKKVKRYLFLLSTYDKNKFCEAAFSPNGLPELNYSDGKTWGNDFLVKVASYVKQNK
jgi:hypothetical protein